MVIYSCSVHYNPCGLRAAHSHEESTMKTYYAYLLMCLIFLISAPVQAKEKWQCPMLSENARVIKNIFSKRKLSKNIASGSGYYYFCKEKREKDREYIIIEVNARCRISKLYYEDTQNKGVLFSKKGTYDAKARKCSFKILRKDFESGSFKIIVDDPTVLQVRYLCFYCGKGQNRKLRKSVRLVFSKTYQKKICKKDFNKRHPLSYEILSNQTSKEYKVCLRKDDS